MADEYRNTTNSDIVLAEGIVIKPGEKAEILPQVLRENLTQAKLKRGWLVKDAPKKAKKDALEAPAEQPDTSADT